MALGRFNRARDEGRGGEGPHRVVDEHDVRLRGGEGLEPGQNALLARRAADRRRAERRRRARREMRGRLVIERTVLGADDHGYGGKRKARGERLQSMDDERTPGAAQILLRPVRAEP